MSSKDRLIAILRGSVVSKIRFKFPGGISDITIDKTVFHKCAGYLANGQVEISAAKDGELAEGTDAHYRWWDNTLVLKNINGRSREGVSIHEALHGYFDINNIDLYLNYLEASLVLVEMLYFRMTGVDSRRYKFEPWISARPAADYLLDAYKKGTAAVPDVGAETWGALLDAIGKMPIYNYELTYPAPHDG